MNFQRTAISSVKSVAKIFFVVLIFASACKKPAPIPQKFSEIKELNIKGIRVYLKKNINEVVSAQLFTSGGNTFHNKEMAGMEVLALKTAVWGSTKNMSADQIRMTLENSGATLQEMSDIDHSSIQLNCPLAKWDMCWEIFSGIIASPAFDPGDFNRIREMMISDLKMKETEPLANEEKMAMNSVFNGMNLNNWGNVDGLNKITVEMAKSYYDSIMAKSRIFLVVTGKVTEEEITKKVNMVMTGLPKGKMMAAPDTNMYMVPAGMMVEAREGSMNYLYGISSAPKAGSKDAVALGLGLSLVNERLWEEFRTKRNLPSPSVGIRNNHLHPFIGIMFDSPSPNESLKLLAEVLKGIKQTGFTTDQLKSSKDRYLTHHFMNLEPNRAQCYQIGQYVLAGDYHLWDDFSGMVTNMPAERVNGALKKYLKNINWTYLGKKEAVDEGLLKQMIE